MDPKGARSKQPADTPFKQQRMEAWEPVLTPKAVIVSFILCGLIFIPFGYLLKSASDSVMEYRVIYDSADEISDPRIMNSSLCRLKPGEENSFSPSHSCSISITVDKLMSPPIYIYYELSNYYQNHRKYSVSKNDEQMLGRDVSDGQCDLNTAVSPVYNVSSRLEDRAVTERRRYPCGLIANTMFNDIFALKTPGFTMLETEITWPSDRQQKYQNPDPKILTDASTLFIWQSPNYSRIIQSQANQQPVPGVTGWKATEERWGLTNEHFIGWMRMAALPTFKKLYGRIMTPIEPGTVLTFEVQSNFLVQSFKGHKALVVTTLSWWGEKNPFLGSAYIALGSVCLIMATLFLLKEQFAPRKLGDTKYLVWKYRT